jgi:MFS family permease
VVGRAPSWNAQLGVLWFGQCSTLAGATFVFPFLPLMVRTVGVHDPGAIALWSGGLVAGSQLAQTAAAPVWGRVADRIGRKPMVVRAMVGLGLLMLATGLAPNIWFLLAMRILTGLVSGNIAANNALVASIAPRDRLAHSLGVVQSGAYIGTTAGPALGALFVSAFGIRPAFAVAALLPLLAGSLVVLFVREDFAAPERRPVPHRTRGIIRQTGIARALVTLLVLALLTQSIGIALAISLPLRVNTLVGTAHIAAAVGGVAALQACCAGVAALYVSRLARRHSYRTLFTVVPVVAAIGYALIAAIPSFGVMVAFAGLGGLATGALVPSITTLLGAVAPAEVRAELFGYSASAMAAGGGSAPLLAGFLAGRFGTPAPFLMVCGLDLILAVWAWTRLGPRSGMPLPIRVAPALGAAADPVTPLPT